MRSFSDAQLAAQKLGGYDPIVVVYFADPKGVGAYTGHTRWREPAGSANSTGEAKRVVVTEEEFGANGYVLLDNSDGTFNNVDLAGSLVTMLWAISGTQYLSAYSVPMWVVGQPEYSGVRVGAEVGLNLSSEMSLWANDVTSRDLSPDDSANFAFKYADFYGLWWQAIMEQICEIPTNDQIVAFNHWNSNTSLLWDSTDRPLNVDAQAYWYPAGSSRMQILRNMMALSPTDNAIRWQADDYTNGGRLHYFALSTTAQQTYEASGCDYIQWLSRVRNSGLVIPNEVIVTAGNQSDVSVKSQPSYNRRPSTEYIHLGQVATDSIEAMMTNPATVRIAQAEAMAGGGEFYGRMNLASQINDYITVMDSQRTENDLTGYIKRITRDTADWSRDGGGMTTTIGDVNRQDRSNFYQARVEAGAGANGGMNTEAVEKLLIGLADDAKYIYDNALTSLPDGAYENLRMGESVSANDFIVKIGTLWYKTDCTKLNNSSGDIRVAMGPISSGEFGLCMVSGDIPSLTHLSDGQLFLSPTPGIAQVGSPTTAGYYQRMVGFTNADRSTLLQPSGDFAEITS